MTRAFRGVGQLPAKGGKPERSDNQTQSEGSPPQHPWCPYADPVPQPRGRARIGVGLPTGLVVTLVGVGLLSWFTSLGAPASPGDSEKTDAPYAECDEGVMSACDALYWESAVGSQLKELGATFGGRTSKQHEGCCPRD